MTGPSDAPPTRGSDASAAASTTTAQHDTVPYPSTDDKEKQRDADQILASAEASKQAKRKKEEGRDGAYEEDVFVSEEAYERAQKGKEKMKRLGWIKMSVLLCVEAVALGALSLPGAFASLGMVAGVILTIGIGLIAIYAGCLSARLYMRYPHLRSYADAGRILFGGLGPRWARFGFEFIGLWLILLLVFNGASHTLTGTLMWQSLTDTNSVCSIVWVVISAILLALLALPPTFTEFAILGYIDFVSIVAAILITMIATGVKASQSPGLDAVEWSAWPAPGTDFVKGFSAVSQIVFAYSFNTVLYSFQQEMHRPQDAEKSVWAVGLVQVVIYTLTGAIIYRFVGQDVASPALLSNPGIMPRIAFGIALPVIFLSGSINLCVVARYVHGRIFEKSRHRYINTGPGWLVWGLILTVEAIIAFVIAEAIPFFSDLLSLISALFISGFSFYLPGLFWFFCIRQGSVFRRENMADAAFSLVTVTFGFVVLVAGLYASIASISRQYQSGSVRSPFSCSPIT
ncbi:unnamed protein product [Parajaminaea phylloscopi]